MVKYLENNRKSILGFMIIVSLSIISFLSYNIYTDYNSKNVQLRIDLHSKLKEIKNEHFVLWELNESNDNLAITFMPKENDKYESKDKENNWYAKLTYNQKLSDIKSVNDIVTVISSDMSLLLRKEKPSTAVEYFDDKHTIAALVKKLELITTNEDYRVYVVLFLPFFAILTILYVATTASIILTKEKIPESGKMVLLMTFMLSSIVISFNNLMFQELFLMPILFIAVLFHFLIKEEKKKNKEQPTDVITA
jgi:hypothetical protein